MTAAELVRAVRKDFILHDRAERFWRKVPEVHRAGYAAGRRRTRAETRALLSSEAFKNVAAGFVAAGDYDVFGLASLATWLGILPLMSRGDLSPQELVSRANEQIRMRQDHVRKLREIAATLTVDYRAQLERVADNIEGDPLALHGTEIGVSMLGNSANLGTRGAAANPEGAWRGWFIRELRDRLPYLDRTPEPFATMAQLLTMAEIPDVTSPLVRAILKGGRT